MLRFRPLWIALLSVLLLTSLAACGGDPSVDVPSPDEPSQLQTYTAVLIDRSTEPASTSYFAYVEDTTVGEILTALAEKMDYTLDLQSASVTESDQVCSYRSPLRPHYQPRPLQEDRLVRNTRHTRDYSP